MGKRKRPQMRWSVDDEYDSFMSANGMDMGECYWLEIEVGRWQMEFPPATRLKDYGAISFNHKAFQILLAYKWESKPPFDSVRYRSELADQEIDLVFPMPCPAIVDNAFLLFKHSEALMIESGLQAKADILCGYYWGLIHRDTQEAETIVGQAMKRNGKKIGKRNQRAKWEPDRQEVLAVLVPIGSTCTKKTQAIEKAAKQFGKSPRLLHDVINGLKIADKDWLIKKN